MVTWSVASSRLRYVLSAYIQLSGDIWRSRTFGDGQVVAFEDFKRLSAGTSLAEVKVLVHVQAYEYCFAQCCCQAAGKWRQEGKSYEIQDGMNTKAA